MEQQFAFWSLAPKSESLEMERFDFEICFNYTGLEIVLPRR
jgi:hypothetical protein